MIGNTRVSLGSFRERFAVLGVGLLANGVIDYSFDFILYPFVIWKMGLIRGGLIMLFLSFVTCYATFLFYDWSKKDWLGIETIKGLRDYEGQRKTGKFVSWILRQSMPLALLILSIKFDPFITTAYLRFGAHNYAGLNRRDWKIFISSLLIGNGYWTFASFMGISLLEYIL
jgi:hypothetical protein